MIVERNDNRKQDFENLDVGQFFDSNGYVFVKIESSVSGLNALNCGENHPVHFMSYTKVTPLNGKVVIE